MTTLLEFYLQYLDYLNPRYRITNSSTSGVATNDASLTLTGPETSWQIANDRGQILFSFAPTELAKASRETGFGCRSSGSTSTITMRRTLSRCPRQWRGFAITRTASTSYFLMLRLPNLATRSRRSKMQMLKSIGVRPILSEAVASTLVQAHRLPDAFVNCPPRSDNADPSCRSEAGKSCAESRAARHSRGRALRASRSTQRRKPPLDTCRIGLIAAAARDHRPPGGTAI